MNGDTIAAVATPPGQGAIALIRISGPLAISIAAEIFAGELGEDRFQSFGRLINDDGETIDEVLLTAFHGPRSFTGEDVVEISCHGGLLATQKVLERIIEAGARPAEPGEFSQRAFLNGKMDLTQAEAVMDLISAKTELALKAANEQLAGRLGGALMDLREQLIAVIAQVEAYIDFPEEDIDPETGEALRSRIGEIRKTVDELIGTADQGRILREGVRTVICGAPNVGKSSLLNLLLGFDRAIVSETAGTTRDTIEEVINLRGIPLRLVDTAGVRESDDTVEREGISRAQAQIEKAELILEVVDASDPGSALDLAIPDNARHLRILNKVDLDVAPAWESAHGVRLSCTERSGIEELTEAILELLGGGGEAWGSHLIAINVRHKDCLDKARGCLEAASARLEAGDSPEFIALELREALEGVGEVVGKADVEEILGEIFARFCIGK